jgi:thiamine-monophosphate kinase
MVKRSGAKASDLLVVTGTIGDAVLGLKLRNEPGHQALRNLSAEAKAHLSERYLLPQPRNAVAEAIRTHASAAIDLSDGLVGDVAKLAAASDVAAQIDATAVPLSEAAKAAIAAAPDLLEAAITGGDDYEIAAAVPGNRVESLAAACRAAGIALTTIGRIEPGAGVNVTGPDGTPLQLKRASFSHF